MKHNTEIRRFRAALRILERATAGGLEAESECCGVTGAQCHFLLELDHAGSGTVNDLAARLELNKSTVSRTAETLVKDGLISRGESAADRRLAVLALTDAGRERIAVIHALCDRFYAAVLDRVPPAERETFIRTATSIGTIIMEERRKYEHCCVPSAE
jgi:DNA-binding MarR family transcriptional regulator